jgi:NAD(P)-dependent dehydrogenase (short-subunit alcohol dehydrogenase family)
MGVLDGLCIAVTGATGNLGGAVCARLLSDGARVHGIDRHAPTPSFLAHLPSGGAGFTHAAAQLGDEAQVEAALEGGQTRGGPSWSLWALVNLAGAWEGGKPAQEAPLDVFDRMIDANLRTCYTASRAAMRRLIRPSASGGGDVRGGRIVNVSALTAVSGVGIAGSAAYAAAKLGVVGLTRALAEEGAPHGIRVNCIAPGTLRTAANVAAMPGADPTRWVPLEDVASAIAFLCAPGSAAVNGAVLPLPSL